jgi:hypothetical protein
MSLHHTIFLLFATYSFAYGFKETSLFEKVRIWLIGLHPFFYKLVSCYYCLSFWISILVLFIDTFAGITGQLFLWGLTAAMFSLIMSGLIDRLFAVKNDE